MSDPDSEVPAGNGDEESGARSPGTRPSNEDGDDDYFRRIEEHFARRRGGPLLLSPRDWRLVSRWKERDIPLPVVLRGINRAFDRFDETSPPGRRINSLAYCSQHVEAVWEEHREALVTSAGGGDRSDERLPGASDHLRGAADACRRAARQADGEASAPLEEIAAALEELAGRSAAGELDATDLHDRATGLEADLGHRLDRPPRAVLEELGLPRFSPYSA